MSIPTELKYTESHEWVRTEADGTLAIGITNHAQQALGDIVFLELPEVGRVVAVGDTVGVIESVKAASDIYTPVAGEIVASNEDAAAAPDQVNSAPYDAWLFKIRPVADAKLDQLLDADAYGKTTGE